LEEDLDILTGDEQQDISRLTYIFFISIVAVIAIVVGLAYYLVSDEEVREVLRILDTIFALIFLLDFLIRLRLATDRRRYLFRAGWLDLIFSIPGIPAMRVIRGLITLRHTRRVLQATPDDLEALAHERLGESVLMVTVLGALIVISVGSILIVIVEAGAPGATIVRGADAIWWSLVTVATVGYGDEVPVTTGGRWIGSFMIVVGVALFTTITSFLASTFTGRRADQQREEQIALARQNQEQMEEMLQRIIELEQRLAAALDVEEPSGVAPDEQEAGET
jgi:voltage-gated potassium channel Kch